MSNLQDRYRPLLETASFAARAHQGQLRKDQRTPYISHPFRVCLIVREVFGLDDPGLLLTALLHDTIEDTTTDFDDLNDRVGPQVAHWVSALTKDKRLIDADREARYCEGLEHVPWQVKACKLADIFDNLMDSPHLGADRQRKTFDRSERYLRSLGGDPAPELRKPVQLVKDLLAELRDSSGSNQGDR